MWLLSYRRSVVVLVSAGEDDLLRKPTVPDSPCQFQAVLQVNRILDLSLVGWPSPVEHALDSTVHACLIPFQPPADVEEHPSCRLKVRKQTQACIDGRGGERYAELLSNSVESLKLRINQFELVGDLIGRHPLTHA